MKLPYAPYHIECLLKKHHNKLSEYELKFVIDMLLKSEQDQTVTIRQYNFFETVVHRLKCYEKIIGE